MTPPAPSGGSSPLRIGGLALIGVGVIAALIGVASLIGGGGGDSDVAAPATTDPASTSAVEPAPATTVPLVPSSAPGASATPEGAVPVPSFSPTPAPVRTTAPVPAPVTPTAPAVAKSALRVYNNSTITGLAARAASEFRSSGWPVDSVANYSESQGVIATTTVYYRPGTGEQAPAESLAKTFGMRAQPRFPGITQADPGIIVIVTNDFRGE